MTPFDGFCQSTKRRSLACSSTTRHVCCACSALRSCAAKYSQHISSNENTYIFDTDTMDAWAQYLNSVVPQFQVCNKYCPRQFWSRARKYFYVYVSKVLNPSPSSDADGRINSGLLSRSSNSEPWPCMQVVLRFSSYPSNLDWKDSLCQRNWPQLHFKNEAPRFQSLLVGKEALNTLCLQMFWFVDKWTSKAQANVSWISSKAKLEISLLKSRCCEKLQKSGLEIGPATGERRSQDRMCSKTKSLDSTESL